MSFKEMMARQPRFLVYNEQELALGCASYMADGINKAVGERGRACVALSGGGTPRATLEALATKGVDWANLWIFFVDERSVPPTHADSNYRMVKEALLDRVPIPEAQVFRMMGELGAQEAAREYVNKLEACFGSGTPRFDMVQLGMGDDGHTASLFPHTAGLDEEAAAAIANHVPQKDTWRISLSKTAINAATDVFFLIAGRGKAEVLRQVLEGEYEPRKLPSQLINPPTGLTLILDEGAAASIIL